jgi:low temperature requirement protein LtrA
MEAVPVLELVAVFVELIEPVDVREINALKVWAGDDDELFERVALFVLVGLFGPLLVIKAEADDAPVAKGDSECPEDRVLVFDGTDV